MREPRMIGPRPVVRAMKPVNKATSAEQQSENSAASPENVNAAQLENPSPAAAPEVKAAPAAAAPTASTSSTRPTAARQQKTAPPQKSKDSKFDAVKMLLFFCVFLLCGAVGLLFYDKIQKEKSVSETMAATADSHKSDVNSRIAEINRLQDSINVVIAEKAQLGEELTSERAKLAELEDLKQQLQSKQASINKLNKKLESTQRDYQMANANIQSLNASKSMVLKEKKVLNAILQAKDDSLKMVMAKVDELAKKQEAATVAHVASAPLKAGGIYVTALTTGGKEIKPADTYKAITVGKIKASMTIMKNEATTGVKDIYLKFVEPGGATLHDGPKTFTIDGKKTYFTDKRQIDLGAGQHEATFLMVKGSKYKAGTYQLEFYADGAKIGQSSITLVN